jgi:hypothetical protein
MVDLIQPYFESQPWSPKNQNDRSWLSYIGNIMTLCWLQISNNEGNNVIPTLTYNLHGEILMVIIIT